MTEVPPKGAKTGKANTGRPERGPMPLNVRVQLPSSLNWDVTTLVKFASGVTVGNGADGAVG